jgi:sugar phosphate permease
MNEKIINENETENIWKSWRKRIFFTVWVTYMIYYIGRTNFGIAKPFMINEYPQLTADLFGIVGMTFFFAYAFGQFVNGFLGDKLGARRLVAFGLIASSIINLLLGTFGEIIWVLSIFWGINGFVQSMGWAPSVKTIANWYPPEDRGKWSGRLGTSYQIGGALSWFIAMFLIITLGLNWRYAFWIPGIIMLIMGIHWYVRVRNAPETVGLPTLEEERDGKIEIVEVREDNHVGFQYTIGSILKNKTVWFASFGLFCLNIIRYGITEWLPYIMASEVIGSAFFPLWKVIAFPIGGAFGALTCIWLSDKYLKKRRTPIICIFFLILALTLYIYTFIPPLNWFFGVPLLILIGFLTFGPHVLLVSTIPMEFGTRKAASSAAGFIDGWGYIGSAFTTYWSGAIIGTGTPYDTFLLWIFAALAGGIVLIANWNSIPEKRKYI